MSERGAVADGRQSGRRMKSPSGAPGRPRLPSGLEEEHAMQETTLSIDGMHCGHCVTKVTKALAALPTVTVKDVKVGSATVSHDPERVTYDALAAAVREAGYETGVRIS
jgi:copper chaperone